MKAFEIIPRVEPLVKISDYYRKNNNWIIAHTFSKLSCELPYPEQCILFIDNLAYEYKRWHIYSIIAFYVGNFEEGEKACNLAIENGMKNNIDSVVLDRNNLKFYLDTTKDNKIITKNEFIKIKIEEIQKNEKQLSYNEAYKKAKLSWKVHK